MNITHRPINFEDARGAIRDIFPTNAPSCVTVITTKKGAVRGNHYHKVSIQHAYVVSGRMVVFCREPNQAGRVDSYEMVPGDVVMHVPMEEHAYIALEDTVFLAFAEGLRQGEDYEKDTYRVDPLFDPAEEMELHKLLEHGTRNLREHP